MESEESPGDIFAAFVDSFSLECHPRFMAISGGEALLRPQLVKKLALRARNSGTKSSVLSGMFFAKKTTVPKPIHAAILAVDHFSVSMDEFHEREVPRSNVFAVLSNLLDCGRDLSIHIAGRNASDPYLDDLVKCIQQRFGNRIPMLVNTLSPFGRANTFMIKLPEKRVDKAGSKNPDPCTMAAWPVVGFDGVVAACGNDNLIGCVPSHLRLGDIRVDRWADIQARCKESPFLIALRTYGPEYLQRNFGEPGALSSIGYCNTCIRLHNNVEMHKLVGEHMRRPSSRALGDAVVEMQVEMGAVAFAKRYSHPRFAELVLLGCSA